MKKFGFTLAEVLITLSIIAIAAATLAPSYLKSRPDKYKYKVINCYNLINDANERLLGNPFVYRVSMLTSTETPASDTGFTSYIKASDNTYCKYPLLMGEILNLEPDGSCNAGTYEGKSSDSTTWKFERGSGDAYYIISVTFPRNDGTSCSYSVTCKYPNVFKFKVDVYGDVKAADDDPLTKVYLNNMYNIHKSQDYEALGS